MNFSFDSSHMAAVNPCASVITLRARAALESEPL